MADLTAARQPDLNKSKLLSIPLSTLQRTDTESLSLFQYALCELPDALWQRTQLTALVDFLYLSHTKCRETPQQMAICAILCGYIYP